MTLRELTTRAHTLSCQAAAAAAKAAGARGLQAGEEARARAAAAEAEGLRVSPVLLSSASWQQKTINGLPCVHLASTAVKSQRLLCMSAQLCNPQPASTQAVSTVQHIDC